MHVSNCVIWNDWGKSLEIGAETRAEEIFDILFDSCHIIHACVNPLDCYNVDYADVHDVVQRYEREGKLKGSKSADMEREILRLISLPQTSRWFNPEVTVVTETSILKWGEKINRPDRVVIDGNRVTVIDYKFGALEREEYKEKVSEYMQLVRDMGYTHVEGCIWYVEKEKFVAVE